jgi:hypothetical protein
MRREEFVFSIGFEGSAAIVDGRLRARYGGLSTRRLAEEGLFKQAICSALFSGKPDEFEEILSIYNQRTVHPVASVEELKRIYGAFGVPEGVTKIIII